MDGGKRKGLGVAHTTAHAIQITHRSRYLVSRANELLAKGREVGLPDPVRAHIDPPVVTVRVRA